MLPRTTNKADPMLRRPAVLLALLLPVGACHSADRTADNATAVDAPRSEASIIKPTPRATPLAQPLQAVTSSGPRSCAAEIGAAAAARRVEICRNVSPATHPPCNAANSCAMIEDEIARSCALFGASDGPIQGCEVDPRGPQAAANVVRRYYAAIDAHDYGTAWIQWGDDGQPGQTLGSFENGFAHTRSTRVTIATLPPSEGGAGSLYQTVPVTIEAILDNGNVQRFTGSYVVRRVNDVDGASASQRRWHIDSAQLRPATIR